MGVVVPARYVLRGEKLGSNQDDREESRAAAAALFEDEELAEDAVGSNDA